MFAADGYYRTGDAERALASARQVEEISRKLGGFLNMAAVVQLAFGSAHLAAERADDAIEAARASIEPYDRVERQMAGAAAATLAEALLLAGDLCAAHAAAEDAIALCRRSLRAPYQAQAYGVLARALLRRDGHAAREAAEAALAETAAVLGDDATRERLLREARHLYQEIGAPGHAARLEKETAP